MLNYSFMQRAFLSGIMLGLIIPLMGVLVVNRHSSSLGDALAHVSLAGIALGLISGIGPLWGSILACLVGVFLIDYFSRKYPGRGDLATAIVMSGGIGLAALLSRKVPSSMSFESYLFGSIVTVTWNETILSVVICLVVILAFFYNYYALLYMSIDPQSAALSDYNTLAVSQLMNALLAVTIALSARLIGVLMVSSLLVLPAACAILISSNYRQVVVSSMAFGVAFVVLGLLESYYLGLQPGGAMVVTGILACLVCLFISPRRGRGR